MSQFYFAYGSNLNLKDLREFEKRNGINAKKSFVDSINISDGIFFLPDYQLQFPVYFDCILAGYQGNLLGFQSSTRGLPFLTRVFSEFNTGKKAIMLQWGNMRNVWRPLGGYGEKILGKKLGMLESFETWKWIGRCWYVSYAGLGPV